MTDKRILAGGGDVGGARALMPVLAELEKQQCRFAVLDHGYITEHAPTHWVRVPDGDVTGASNQDLDSKVGAYIFTTSVADVYPLQVARRMQECGVPVICLLDNWMNYRMRLEADGRTALMPDVYAVMDDLARDEAIADGIPASVLQVTGQPALAEFQELYEAFPREATRAAAIRALGADSTDRRLIAFISEPVTADQGADSRSPHYRGYTENVVLDLLARSLQPFAGSVVVGIVPHPREDADRLLDFWGKCRGRLDGGRLAVSSGRDAVFAADAVCGMASLLLYESMLLAKPTLSLQPGLRTGHLRYLQHKGLTHFVTDESEVAGALEGWVRETLGATRKQVYHPDLALHREAPARLAQLIQESMKRS